MKNKIDDKYVNKCIKFINILNKKGILIVDEHGRIDSRYIDIEEFFGQKIIGIKTIKDYEFHSPFLFYHKLYKLNCGEYENNYIKLFNKYVKEIISYLEVNKVYGGIMLLSKEVKDETLTLKWFRTMESEFHYGLFEREFSLKECDMVKTISSLHFLFRRKMENENCEEIKNNFNKWFEKMQKLNSFLNS